MMRGTDEMSGSLFSYVDLEEPSPPGTPLRKIRQVVNDALASLDAEFDRLYAAEGRPSIAPERLIRASSPLPSVQKDESCSQIAVEAGFFRSLLEIGKQGERRCHGNQSCGTSSLLATLRASVGTVPFAASRPRREPAI